MSPEVRRTITAGMIWGGIVAVCGGLAFATDWVIRTGRELDSVTAYSDSVAMADSLRDVRIERLERKLRIQTKKLQTITRPRREGWLRRKLREFI